MEVSGQPEAPAALLTGNRFRCPLDTKLTMYTTASWIQSISSRPLSFMLQSHVRESPTKCCMRPLPLTYALHFPSISSSLIIFAEKYNEKYYHRTQQITNQKGQHRCHMIWYRSHTGYAGFNTCRGVAVCPRFYASVSCVGCTLELSRTQVHGVLWNI
jgi:hypothetical protein